MRSSGTGDDEWLDRLLADVGAVAVEQGATEILVNYRIDDGAEWHLGVRDGKVLAGRGLQPDADATFVAQARVVESLRTGIADVQRLIASGEVRVTGDVGRLTAARETLSLLHAATRPSP